MHPTAVQLSVLPLAVACAAALGACSGERICTEEERVAVRVNVWSPFGYTIDRVTAERDHEMVCALSSANDAGTSAMFRCIEQGEGTYVIRAYSGHEVWATETHVDANECHTTEIRDVQLVLSPNNPTPFRDTEGGEAGQGR